MANATLPLGPQEGEVSPLAEARPTSLEDLFNKDPLQLTRQDREQTVAYFRKARETFLAEEAGKVKKPKSPVAAAPAAPKVTLDKTLTIDDLDLDL